MKLDIMKKGEVVKTVKVPDTIGCAAVMAMVGCIYGAAIGLMSDISEATRKIIRKK